jgi:hypothetical protein
MNADPIDMQIPVQIPVESASVGVKYPYGACEGRKPLLTAAQRDVCRVEREKRINGEAYVSTPLLALRFGVSERTIRYAAVDQWNKHQVFLRRLVRLSAGLRRPIGKNSP